MICAALVGILMIGAWEHGVVPNENISFLDYCPNPPPTVCWQRWQVDKGSGTDYFVCVDKDKHVVYEGRGQRTIIT